MVIVIGLALFAFIAGDAWKVLQPHQSHDVGEVNGETLSAQDYQNMVEEYTEVIKFSSGMSSLNDEQTNQVKDEVWRSYVNNKLIEKEAKKLGITVSKAEIQSIINEGVNPLLQQTPFRNPQTGAFDKDMLKKFLADYSKMDKTKMPSQYVEYYEGMHKLWSFVEKTLIQSRLAEKYQALVTKALFSNPVEAQDAFDARVNQMDLMLAAVPYSSIVDSTIVVKESELKELYDKKKELLHKLYDVLTQLEDEKGKHQKLTAQINRDYENSSIPSSKAVQRKKITNSREKTGRKPGGQPGHKGHCRRKQEPTQPVIFLPPPEEVLEDSTFKKTAKTIVKQMVNIRMVLDVTEYHADVYYNSQTGERVHAVHPLIRAGDFCLT